MSGGVRMREYKFRAWDSWWDKMHYFDFTKNIEATPDDELKGLWILHKEGSVYAIQDKIKIMQYTGLKDKNGKEIYEVDIVLYDRNIHKDIDTAKFKVVWAKDRYVLQEIKHKYYIDDVTWELVEVIGNIYENPELLESGE
jgi:uncharacterized phage protein (TIGR01671 family)